jgi:hypothetical protein
MRKLFVAIATVIATAAVATLPAGTTVAAADPPAGSKAGMSKASGDPTTRSAALSWRAVEFHNTGDECVAAGAQGRQAGRWLSYRCVGAQLQILEVFITLSVTGAIRNADGRCLDIPGGDDDNGTSVRLINCNGTSAQRWTFEGTGLDNIRALGQKCIDVQGGGTGNGNRVQIWTCNTTAAQDWLLPSDGNQFWMRNPQSGRCLAANGDGAGITDCASGGQFWTIIPG